MSPFIRSSFLFILPFMLDVSVASADTVPAEWTVVEASGKVEIWDGARQALGTQPGAVLAAPFTITTGGDGRAVISHGQDRLSIGADARLGVPLPSPDDNGLVTRIRQTLGSVLYQVEHRIKDSFEVDTPYLVSVVKGTTFNIHATLEDSTVALIEGRLWVHTPDLKSETILTPGQAAIKSRAGRAIVVKDQQALSTLRQGPITIGSGDSDSTDGSIEDRAAGRASGASPSTTKGASGGTALLSHPGAAGTDALDANTHVGSLSAAASVGGKPGLALGVRGASTSADVSVGGASNGLGVAAGAASTGISVGGASTGLGIAGGTPSGVGAASPSSGSPVDLGASVGGTTAGITVGGGRPVSVGSTITGTTSTGTTAATVTATTPIVTTGAPVPAVGGVVGKLLK